MYSAFQRSCERLLRIPADPHPPPGDDASTQIYRAAKNYYKYRVALWALMSFATILAPLVFTILIVIFAIAEKLNVFWALIPGALVLFHMLIALFHLAVLRLNYEKRWYIVSDRSLRVREGVVGVREMTVTFANIQNISVSQGPVQRLLGIADLRVEPAGGGGSSDPRHGGRNLHTAWFRGIDNAPVVRELIQQRLRQWKDAGLGDHEDVTAEVAQLHGLTDMLPALRDAHAEAQALRIAAVNCFSNAGR